ncbi:MAG: crosslink repair DNA glycosylase YcaQ family protein [Pseudomonadota bacterium]
MSISLLDNATARRLFLDKHLLSGPPSGSATGQGLCDLIHTLGFVQLDSVNTMARAHDLILWSRRQSYKPASLRWANDRMRGTFEHWTHDASKISMALFPHWRLRFARDGARLREKWAGRGGGHLREDVETVLRHVSDHGPVSSSDMPGDRPEKTTGWWDWHPSKIALEYLWRSGELSVTRRDGFRKVYDLTERVIPPEALNARFTVEETVDWACSAALDRLGFATSGELAKFWDLITPAEAKAWVVAARASGRVVDVEVECVDGTRRVSVAWPETLAQVPDLPEPPQRMRVLSPFDPALRDRNRAERLFGFHYRIEIFVPESKRRYGYYVFPLMEGARMVGRIDMSADRDRGLLVVRAIWPEPGVAWGKGRQARLEAELDRILRLARCDRVEFQDGFLRR